MGSNRSKKTVVDEVPRCPNGHGELRLREAVKFVQSHWKTVQTMKGVAMQYNVDAANLTRCFRHVTGVTPKRYLDNLRRQFVVEQIRRNLPLGYEIGAQLGFENDLSFYRWVKRAFGCPYRELIVDVRKADSGPEIGSGPSRRNQRSYLRGSKS